MSLDDFASNVENSVDELGGQGNTSTQAGTVYQTINHYYMSGRLEKSYKGGRSFTTLNDENGDSFENPATGSPDISNSPSEQIIEDIEVGSTDRAFVNVPRMETRTDSNVLPRNSKEIGIWYYQKLSEMDRCFVNACAVLHGATLSAIAEATRELYTSLKEKNELVQAQAQVQELPAPIEEISPVSSSSPVQMPESLMWVYLLGQRDERVHAAQTKASTLSSTPLPVSEDSFLRDIDSLMERTHTYLLRINNAARVFWKDADESGLSRFSIELLCFLAGEAAMEDMFGTQSGQRLLDVIKQWPSKYQGERSWRSANALGVIWWHQDARSFLWRQAAKWAKSQQKQHWEHAAALLDGAYQIEYDTMRFGPDDAVNSSVLQLLDTWITTAHEATTKRGEGYAAARAYALIGRKSPEIALRGLDRLLRFPLQSESARKNVRDPKTRDPLEELGIFGLKQYVDIARSGHIRQVLRHLAEGAKYHIQRKKTLQVRSGQSEDFQQSTTALQVILTAFFHISSCSLSAVDTSAGAIYSSSENLLEYPSCPDTEGKDILLAGLLTTAEPLWQDQLAILLGSLMMENNHPAVFHSLVRWGEVVLKDQSMDAALLEDAYVQFLVKVGQLLLDWSTGRARLIAIRVYKRQLTLWLTDRRLPHPRFKDLAQKVLKQLPTVR